MNKLTKKIAKNLAKKYLLKKEIDPYHFIHTKKVVQIIKIISKNKKIDKECLEICAWVHDIGYSLRNCKNCDPYHAEDTLKLLKKERYKITNIIKDCILNHGSKGKPKTKEGKLLQIATKFNIIDKSFITYLISGKANGEEEVFLKKRMTSAIKMIKKLKTLEFEKTRKCVEKTV